MVELDFEKKLVKLGEASNRASLKQMRRGIERETLRVDNNGYLSSEPHPAFLGSKLCHPLITTDFSEAQPELITPPSTDVAQCLSVLDEIFRFIYQGLDSEILWSASMPCVLADDGRVPLADYGESNIARLKRTYRRGLGNRYGRSMQTICAVHYNFSMPDEFWPILAQTENIPLTESSLTQFRSRRYFDLMRNFRRLSWLPIYLFGASPAVCKSFVKDRQHQLEILDEGSLYRPGATSLRNGNLGYGSATQAGMINICYNSLEDYIDGINKAIVTEHPTYQGIEGPFSQVNAGILQSEAEFYTTIRGKCVPPAGTNFLGALANQGVEYIEVRLLDTNPYLPLGIDDEQIRFLDAFLLYCLLTDSPMHDDKLCAAVNDNVTTTVNHGRQKDTRLKDGDNDVSLHTWGHRIIEGVRQAATLLDNVHGTDAYNNSVDRQSDKLNDAELTPSGHILADMKSEAIPFFRFAMNKSIEHRDFFKSRPLPQTTLDRYTGMAEESVSAQTKIDQSNEINFETYLKNINNEYRQLLSRPPAPER